MIPTTSKNVFFKENAELVVYPSITYGLRLDEEEIHGKLEGIGAMKLAIAKILNTERYSTLIYSWDYGVELADLFGRSSREVEELLPERVRAALLMDDRITAVDGFVISKEEHGRVIHADFVVHTTVGDIETGMGVTIA